MLVNAASDIRIVLRSPDFEKANVFHGIIGEPLFYAYIFLVSVVLQSFLTSVFSDSFSRISADAKVRKRKRERETECVCVCGLKCLNLCESKIKVVCFFFGLRPNILLTLLTGSSLRLIRDTSYHHLSILRILYCCVYQVCV